MSQGAGASNVLQPPPPGTPIYGGNGPAIVAVSWTLGAIATVELAIRIYTGFKIVKNGAVASLICAIVAWLLGIPSAILYTMAAKNGLGNHIWIAAFSPKLPDAILYEWIAACTISFAVWFGKLSALLFILEVQGRTYTVWRWILFIVVGVNLVCYIITVPFIFTECVPAAKLWNAALPGHCDGAERAFVWAVFTGAWGALTDAVLAIYPIALVLSLQISKRLKFTLCAVLGLGLFTAVCSIIKTVQFGDLLATEDSTYVIARLMIWGMTEMWLVLIAACLAPIWPFIRKCGQGLNLISQSRESKYKNSYGGNFNSGRPSRMPSAMRTTKSKSETEDTESYSMEDGIRLTKDVHVHSEVI